MNNERMAARWGPISLLQGDLLLLAQRALDETGEADSLVLGATLDPVTPEMVLGGVSPQGLEAWHLLRATYVMTDRATVRSAAFLVSNAVGVVGENHGFGLVEHTIVPCRFYSFDAQFQGCVKDLRDWGGQQQRLRIQRFSSQCLYMFFLLQLLRVLFLLRLLVFYIG
jgi:hypothetical protein